MNKNFLKNIPTSPGVYKMLDDSRNILYIGKAGNLKKRVSSYFTKSNQSLKNQRLIKEEPINNDTRLQLYQIASDYLLNNNYIY